jgi:hypothetical protein
VSCLMFSIRWIVISGGVAEGTDRYATATFSHCITSVAARSPERTAPSTQRT